MSTKVWFCKIGGEGDIDLPSGPDGPMRKAIAEGYRQLTGKEPDFIFSGWGGELTPEEHYVAYGAEGDDDEGEES